MAGDEPDHKGGNTCGFIADQSRNYSQGHSHSHGRSRKALAAPWTSLTMELTVVKALYYALYGVWCCAQNSELRT